MPTSHHGNATIVIFSGKDFGFHTVEVGVFTEAISFVIPKLSNIRITIRMIERSLSLCFIIPPLTIVSSTIVPCLYSFAVFEILLFFSFSHCFHLAGIGCSFSDIVIFHVDYFQLVYFFEDAVSFWVHL